MLKKITVLATALALSTASAGWVIVLGTTKLVSKTYSWPYWECIRTHTEVNTDTLEKRVMEKYTRGYITC